MNFGLPFGTLLATPKTTRVSSASRVSGRYGKNVYEILWEGEGGAWMSIIASNGYPMLHLYNGIDALHPIMRKKGSAPM